MLLSNNFIYNIASSDLKLEDFALPVRLGFFLYKNFNTLMAAAEEIEAARVRILETYGEFQDDTGEFLVAQDKIPLAEAELKELFSLTQEIDIHVFKLSEFNDISLPNKYLSSILFMIEED